MKWSLAGRTPKNLAVIEPKCPSTIKRLGDIAVKTKTHVTVKQAWDKDHGNDSVAFLQNAKRHATNHTSNQKRMPNVYVNSKTDEVIIFLLKV